jgi:hypothetical protein
MKVGYIIGEPGSGKSTLMEAATRGLRWQVQRKPFAMRWLELPSGQLAVELGERRDSFSGTDALSMSVMPKVLTWLEERHSEIVIGEGDRLSSAKFFQAAERVGELGIAALWGTPALLEARRRMRAAALGKPQQDSTWLKGRQSKVANLERDWPHVPINAELSSRDQLLVLSYVKGFDDILIGRMDG